MKRKDLLILLIPSFAVVLLWVIFSVYHQFVSSTIPANLNMEIISIQPNFDVKTIESIKNRGLVNPADSVNAQTDKLGNPISPLDISAPTSSSSGQEASSGGSLQ